MGAETDFLNVMWYHEILFLAMLMIAVNDNDNDNESLFDHQCTYITYNTE